MTVTFATVTNNNNNNNDGLLVFQHCLDVTGGNAETEVFMTCLTSSLQQQFLRDTQIFEDYLNQTRDSYLYLCAALVFFMQAGFAMVCAGAVQRKNLQNTMLKNLLDACGSSIAFYSVGYAFAFGDGSNSNGFIGTTHFFLQDVTDFAFWTFQFTFSAAAATIVAGALAERCSMYAYFYYSLLLCGFVYPVVVHAIWSGPGFLSTGNETPFLGVGVIDYAGSGVVHVTGGMTALVALFILGPRRGRFHDFDTGEPLDVPNPMPGHSISLQMLGTLILWFGWYGFNPGSTLLLDTEHYDSLAALAAANTTLAAAFGGLTALTINLYLLNFITGEITYDLSYCMNGTLSGLVAITAGCGVVEPWAAVVIGIIAGILYLLSSWSMIWYRLDDAVDAVPVHLVNGLWGLIATGIFASPLRLEQGFGIVDHAGLVYGKGASLFGAQWVAAIFIVGWVLGTMVPFFFTLEAYGLFRTDVMAEVHGLDADFAGGLISEGKGLDLTQDEIREIQETMKEKLELMAHTDASTAVDDIPLQMEVSFRHVA